MPHLTVRVVGRDLPGRHPPCGWWENVHVGVQVGRDVPDPIPGDAAEAVFDVPVQAVDGDYKGKAVHGTRGGRFLYLSWGEVDPGGGFTMFRRAKLHLDAIPAAALKDGAVVEARLALTDDKQNPVCATIRPPALEWRLLTD